MPITILALGDSLTEGYGIPPGTSFPDVLEELLRDKGHNVSIVNLGLSGDTTWGGLQRLKRYFANNPTPDAAIVELGANDGLMGLDTDEIHTNLDTILSILADANIPVLFTGMRALHEDNAFYSEDFNAIFPALAAKYDTLFFPFFLEGVFGVEELNLWDGLHPNIEGTAAIAHNILPLAEKLVNQVKF